MATVMNVFPMITAHEWATLTCAEMTNKLRECVDMRNSMGGAMYWNMLNDDAAQIANRCVALGADREYVGSILGDGNYC